MRISKEISGNAAQRHAAARQGRGEYEWCDFAPTDPPPNQLSGRRIVIRLPNNILIDTNCVFGEQGGKRRVRIAPGLTGRDLYPNWHVANILMMPPPTRSETLWGDGVPTMRTGQYGVIHLRLGAPDMTQPDRAVVEIDRVEVANNYQQDVIVFADRFQQVQQVWAAQGRFEPPISDLIEEHRDMVQTGATGGPAAKQLIERLQREMSDRSADYEIVGNAPTTDVLPALLKVISGIVAEPPQPLAAIPPEEVAIRRREVMERRRWAAARGAESARFRREVRNAYGSTCVVCGLRLPPLGADSNPGVDAAHILPWADYDLDVVSNGLCLCKLHHWAFDEGLIEIQVAGGNYSIAIPQEAEDRAAAAAFNLDFLRPHVGPIPMTRFPNDPAMRPREEFLRLLRESLYA